MPANRKLYAYGEIRCITYRAQQDLPLPPNWYINRLLEGIMAKAQNDYPIEIIAFLFMSNHLHIVVRVLHPVDTKKFLQYIKRESSHYINRLLGRRDRSIWSKGSDDPVILDLEDTIKRVAYLYANPAASNLTDSVAEYPGLNSWEALLSKESEYELFSNFRITRNSVLSLKGKRVLKKYQQLKLIEEMEELTVHKTRYTLRITPYAMLKAFPESDETEAEVRLEIIGQVKEKEALFREQRAAKQMDVIGASALRLTELNKEHTPKKYGKRMLCLSSSIELRKIYIKAYRAIQEKAQEAYLKWKDYGVLQKYPEGTYAPGGHMVASLWCHNMIYC